MPMNPYLLNNLLVFCQVTSLLLPIYDVIVHENYWVPTIFKNTGSFKQSVHSLVTYTAVDLLSGWGKPCGFPNLVFANPNYFDILFI